MEAGGTGGSGLGGKKRVAFDVGGWNPATLRVVWETEPTGEIQGNRFGSGEKGRAAKVSFLFLGRKLNEEEDVLES